MTKFLVIRLSSLGDIIHTLPAFAALRTARPEAHITWLVEEKGREILDFVVGLDRIVEVRPGLSRRSARDFWHELRRVRSEIRDDRQTAIDFQGLIKSAWLTWLSGSQRRVGFHRSDLREPLASLFYNRHAVPWSNGSHVIDKNLRLLEALGISSSERVFPLEVPEALLAHVRGKLAGLGFENQQKLLIFNVGAAWDTKRWPTEKWRDLVSRLRRSDRFPLLLWGTPQEKGTAEAVAGSTGAAIAPFLAVKDVLALVKTADLVISGDTFALQAACALARPVVGIFGPTSPERNGPFSPHDGTAFHELSCSRCYKRACPELKCLEAVTVDEVADLCLQRLEGTFQRDSGTGG